MKKWIPILFFVISSSSSMAQSEYFVDRVSMKPGQTASFHYSIPTSSQFIECGLDQFAWNMGTIQWESQNKSEIKPFGGSQRITLVRNDIPNADAIIASLTSAYTGKIEKVDMEGELSFTFPEDDPLLKKNEDKFFVDKNGDRFFILHDDKLNEDKFLPVIDVISCRYVSLDLYTNP